MSIVLRYFPHYDDALEVVNDGFLKIFKNIGKYTYEPEKIEASISGWLKKIMVNTCIDRIRSQKAIFLYPETSVQGIADYSTVENLAEKLSNETLMRLVNLLPPSYKIIFNLFVIDGLSHMEISDLLNISIGASKSGLFKAREHLKKLLTETGITCYGQEAF